MEDKERPKKETGHSRLVVAGLIRELTYEAYLGSLQDKEIGMPACLNPKSFYRGLDWDQLHIHTVKGFHVESQAEGTFQGQGRG